MTRTLFADEREDESRLHWFLIISVLVHALLIWLWPQWQAMTVTGVGLDAGGVIEVVTLPGDPSIQPQPPRPGQPVPAAAERPRPEPQPQPQPQPQPAPEPEPEPEPVPQQPEPAPEPVQPEAQPAPEPEPQEGVGEEILVSDQGAVEIPVAPQPQAQPAEPRPEPVQPRPLPQPEPQPVPRPQPVPAPAPEPQPEPQPAPDPEPARQPAPEPVPEPEAQGPAAAEASGETGEEAAQEGDPRGADPDGAAEAAPSLATLATRFGLGSTKSLENVPPEESLDELIIELAVSSDGRPLTYIVVSSSGRSDVDLEMAGLMMRWQFSPYDRDYVEVWRIRFVHTVVSGVTVPTPIPEFVDRR